MESTPKDAFDRVYEWTPTDKWVATYINNSMVRSAAGEEMMEDLRSCNLQHTPKIRGKVANMKRLFQLFIVVALVSGCAAKTEVLSKNASGITLGKASVGDMDTRTMHRMGISHCRSYGKNAVLTLREGQTLTFECK